MLLGQSGWRLCASGKTEAAAAREVRQEGTTTTGVQRVAFSPSKGAGERDVISGTLKHHPHTLRLPGDKQIQTGFNPQG